MTATDRAAKARATRTASKHDRWIGELRGAGWSVVQATEITFAYDGLGDELLAECACGRQVGSWDFTAGRVPLPGVLHAVNSHTCAGAS